MILRMLSWVPGLFPPYLVVLWYEDRGENEALLHAFYTVLQINILLELLGVFK